jgi:hypothetical protein
MLRIYFEVEPYIITATAGEGGSILDAEGNPLPSSEIEVPHNGSYTFTIEPDGGYRIADVLVDDVSQGPLAEYTFDNVTQDHRIEATFEEIPIYTISATTIGFGGKIEPDGDVEVAEGGSQTFTITAFSRFHILDVVVDGVSEGAIENRTFSNVTADHTIEASFEHDVLVTITTPPPNETVSYEGFNFAGTAEYLPEEPAGEITEVIVYIRDITTGTQPFSWRNAEYDPDTKEWSFWVEESYINPGSRTELGVKAKDSTGDWSVYKKIYVDIAQDTEMPVVNIATPLAEENVSNEGFWFSGTAWDEPDDFPSGIESIGVNVHDYRTDETTVYHGEATYDPDTQEWSFWVAGDKISAGYQAGVEVWARDNAGNPNYTQRVSVNVEPYTITATAGDGGSILDGEGNALPGSEIEVPHNGSYTFTIEPDGGYRIADVLVDDVSQGPLAEYTFNNVTQDHRIEASFEAALAPNITRINPTSGRAGNFVYIYGTNFGPIGPSSRVEFSGDEETTDALVRYWNNTYLICYIPDLPEGNYSVKVIKDGASSNEVSFEIQSAAAPYIDMFYPTSGRVGSYISIYGRNFGPRGSSSHVEFLGYGVTTNAIIRYWNDSYVLCHVPMSLRSGTYDVKVITNSGDATDEVEFQVLP